MTGSILTRKNTSEMLHPEFESIVERIIQAVDKEKLIEIGQACEFDYSGTQAC